MTRRHIGRAWAGLLGVTVFGAVVPTEAQVLAPQPGHITVYSGNDLFAACADEVDQGPTICEAYVVGVLDVLGGGNPVNGFRACPPLNIDAAQAADVVWEALSDAPAKRHLTASSLVAEALSEAFPCAAPAPTVGGSRWW